MPGCVCIVDALSSGSAYPALLRDRGLASVHVQSHDPILAVMASTFHRDDHIDNIVFGGDLAKCAAQLARHRPLCVIPGSEVGVLLADRLGEALGLPTNGSALGHARRDKRAMQARIAEVGLRAIPTHEATEWPSIEAWLRARTFPVVLKPPASASTDHVHICHDLAEARRAFDRVLGAMTLFDQPAMAVVVQPFIAGVELVVNTASYAGHHRVTDLWRIDKVIGAHPLYDRSTLISGAGQREVVAYAEAVLDALGIRFGAAHMEVIVDAQGPILIEVGARVMGGKYRVPCEAALGTSQIAQSLDAYLEPRAFLERLEHAYELTKNFSRVRLISPQSGTLVALRHDAEIRGLPSFFQMELHVLPGQPIAETVDLPTAPGFVDLLHADPDVIDRDYRAIRAWERDMYEIAPA